ncbi:Nitrogen permease regulator 3 [Phlyctema vagabunda]|uniref:Nitrogen permease regulator 3 n=1 Tax=Phlyctema vagabunda TaxID=108571 RepID=A0ABR4PBM6_9HELO
MEGVNDSIAEVVNRERDEKPDNKPEKQETNPKSDDDDDSGGMTMFNAVFVLHIPEDGTDDHTFERLQEVYENVAKDFNKALKHAQAQSNYVWKESELILGMKEKARDERRPMSWLWNEILARSSLAAAIRDVSDAIIRSKIATVHLATNPPVDLSLQIPVPFYLSQLPSIIQPGQRNKGIPGLLVTTANPLVDDEGNIDYTHLNKHFALLLLDDKEKVITEIQADNTELSAPLIEYIKLSPPTQSFLQVAQANSISLGDVKTLAQHLIYWRRAIPIPPLHARDTFIVSPNCDSRLLPNASAAWTKAFPLAPSLPSFLASLSAAPRQYKSFFPSKDHRSQYMDMLAWLIRGGWVTQLRTFCWIMVWPEIIYEVEYQIMSEKVKENKNPRTPSKSFDDESVSGSGSDRGGGGGGGNSSSSNNRNTKDHHNEPLTTEQIAEEARLERVAAKAAAETIAYTTAFERKPLPQATAHPSCNSAEHLADMAPYIIKDPHRIDERDSLYMDAIGRRIVDDKARKNWAKFSKYFNGDDALESIALREGMKRKEAWAIISHYQEHLIISRHW